MLKPPIQPMLARLARTLPTGESWFYEPKWDGFRVIAFRAPDGVALQSRNARPLARYFPEVVAALAELPVGVVVDGEVVLRHPEQGFAALMERIHPSQSRVDRLATERPVRYVAFDLLERPGELLLEQPFRSRRAALERLLPAGDYLDVAVAAGTTDAASATAWLDVSDPRWDGVVAKDLDGAYRPGKREMVKVKPERTADCVVGGVRFDATGRPSSLVLGLWTADGSLHHPGAVGSLSASLRRDVAELVRTAAVPLEEHPWRDGFGLEGGATGRLRGAGGRWLPGMTLDWLPVAPTHVVEVAYDRVDALRFRHPARFRRWRPDRDPRSCLVDQLVS